MNKENGFCDAKLLVFHITFLHRFKYLIESWNSGLWDLNVLFFFVQEYFKHLKHLNQ